MNKYKVTKKFGHDRGYSCAFRQWKAQSDCKYLHGYSLAFEITLCSEKLNEHNWVYDFGDFEFLKTWLKDNFDHKLIVAEDDPELELIMKLDKSMANINVVSKISCEAFAQMTFEFIENHIKTLSDELTVEYVTVSEHQANSATYSKK